MQHVEHREEGGGDSLRLATTTHDATQLDNVNCRKGAPLPNTEVCLTLLLRRCITVATSHILAMELGDPLPLLGVKPAECSTEPHTPIWQKPPDALHALLPTCFGCLGNTSFFSSPVDNRRKCSNA